MKGQIIKITRSAFWVIVPLALWWAGITSRDYFIRASCAADAARCTVNSILPMDRFLIGMEDSRADQYSFYSQNFSAIFAVFWALFLAWLPGFRNRTLPITTLACNSLYSCLTLVQVAGWNGTFTELSHLIGQRPRPFVYINPTLRGLDPAHYTSFYSGHASFTAAMVIASLLLTATQTRSKALLLFTALIGEGLIITTTHFRILAGRHFLTDVIAGTIAGTIVAYGVVTLRMRSRVYPSSTNPIS
jgi:membrane-associated phospholipid phosphatase